MIVLPNTYILNTLYYFHKVKIFKLMQTIKKEEVCERTLGRLVNVRLKYCNCRVFKNRSQDASDGRRWASFVTHIDA